MDLGKVKFLIDFGIFFTIFVKNYAVKSEINTSIEEGSRNCFL